MKNSTKKLSKNRATILSKTQTKSLPLTGKPKKKPKNERERSRYPALERKFNLKSRQNLLQDFDYIDKLSDKEKRFLNNFLEEEVITNFKHKGKKFNTTKKDKRRCYNNNNARNRCIMSREEAMGTINYTSDKGFKEMFAGELNPEDHLLLKEEILDRLVENPDEKTRAK